MRRELGTDQIRRTKEKKKEIPRSRPRYFWNTRRSLVISDRDPGGRKKFQFPLDEPSNRILENTLTTAFQIRARKEKKKKRKKHLRGVVATNHPIIGDRPIAREINETTGRNSAGRSNRNCETGFYPAKETILSASAESIALRRVRGGGAIRPEWKCFNFETFLRQDHRAPHYDSPITRYCLSELKCLRSGGRGGGGDDGAAVQ